MRARNSQSVRDNPVAALRKVQREVELGRIAGPFDVPPLAAFKSTPLALREKSTPGEFRLLHTLSYPYNQDG